MSAELDLLVLELGCAVVAGNDSGAMNPLEVAEDEGIARLGLACRAFGQAEMPLSVVGPVVLCEVSVLVVRARLNLAPVAVDDVASGINERLRVADSTAIQQVFGHRVRLDSD